MTKPETIGGLHGIKAIIKQDPKFPSVHSVQLCVPASNGEGDNYVHIGLCSTRDEALDTCPAAILNHLLRAKGTTLVRILPWRRNKDIAAALGVNRGAVSKWRTGEADISQSVRTHIARIFGVCFDPTEGKPIFINQGEK